MYRAASGHLRPKIISAARHRITATAVTKALSPVKTRMVPIDLIDEPSIIMREEMSDEGLDSLARSMKELGQMQAIGVVVEGDRFRVIWGHRRRIAAPRAGLTELECKVFPAGTTQLEARKPTRILNRTVNVVADATYYEQLFEQVCGRDVGGRALVHKPLVACSMDDLIRWTRSPPGAPRRADLDGRGEAPQPS